MTGSDGWMYELMDVQMGCNSAKTMLERIGVSGGLCNNMVHCSIAGNLQCI